LKPYQKIGFNWLIGLYEQGLNGILADEMGLGKTVQTISLLSWLAEEKSIWGPFLVVAPTSTMHNWYSELQKFCPQMKVIPYFGANPNERKLLRRLWTNPVSLGTPGAPFHVLVTNYKLIVADEKHFQRVKWQYMILDEAQAIKSSASQRWKILLGFNCRNRLLLTGTPIQNSMAELWALLHFIMPELFDSFSDFTEWFSKDIESSAEGKGTGMDQAQLRRLQLILQPFMLRRTKKDVLDELVHKVEIEVRTPLSSRQKYYYDMLKRRVTSTAELLDRKMLSKDDKRLHSLMNLVMQFRKVCNHPEIFERRDFISPLQFQEYLRILDELLPKLKAEGHKVLMFCQMTKMMDILEDYFWYRKHTYLRLDGSASIADRRDMVNDFQSEDSDVFIFLLSTRAGGLGINLTAADTVVFYDSDWNPTMDAQAMDRAHRLGQTKQVTVYRLVSKNTIEERILHRAKQKDHIQQMVISG
ncbi:hypothetical protein GUITHDRAFT_44788, partial [Guillardia theta CCMP2712]